MSQSKKGKKVIMAAGGTGGHLFPAQALADKLREHEIDILFAAATLSKSVCFDRGRFPFREITSATPFRGGIKRIFQTFGQLVKGVYESLKLLQQEKPDLVVGFGSFHVFPVLCAAVLKRIPIVLFESNAIPGKVVRLFSRRAKLTGIFFAEAKHYLQGNTVEVEIPKKPQASTLSTQDARRQFALKEDPLTLLIFGGSQGAKAINKHVLEMIPLLQAKQISFQLIHFTGDPEMTQKITTLCQNLNISCYVKDFEPRMEFAYRAADLAICRSGAMTVSELLYNEVPSILIPYPFAADQHQRKNALFLENIGGAMNLSEESLSAQHIVDTVKSLDRKQMKQAIQQFKTKQKKADFVSLVMAHL